MMPGDLMLFFVRDMLEQTEKTGEKRAQDDTEAKHPFP